MAASVRRSGTVGTGGEPLVPSRQVRTREAAPPKPSPGGLLGEREATVHEAKTHLSRLLAEVEAGGTVVITRRGKPVAKLEAVHGRPKRVFGSMKGRFTIDETFFDPLPEEELKLWGEM